MTDFITAVTLARRNVRRNPRRTVLTLLTIIVGCAVIIIMNAFAKGGHDQMIKDEVELSTGHIQIHEKGYRENLTIDYALQRDPQLERYLDKNRFAAGWAPRIYADALASFGDNTSGVTVQGIDPGREKTVSIFHQKLIQGRYLAPGDTDKAVIGSVLARNLSVKTGSSVTLISQGFDGSIAADRLVVKGIFTSRNQEYDSYLVLMPLARANETFTMNGYIHSYTIRAADADHVRPLNEQISGRFASADREILTWESLMPWMVQYIVLDDAGAYIFDAILFLVVAFGILNTIQMSVFERTRELGIMLSIGTNPGQIVWMILAESFIITTLGVFIGSLIGCGVSWYYQINPLDISGMADEIAVYGFTTISMPADASALNISLTIGITLLLGIVFSYPPARRASRLKPVDAIRHL
ncbi:MAG: ABC transporter permease, partial [Spirochaetota bacterium]